MRQRIEKLRRIIRVQDQLQRVAEGALRDLIRETETLQARETGILDTLGRDDALLLGLAPALTERLSELKRHSDRVQTAREHQTELVMEQRRRRRQAEKMAHRLTSKLKRADEIARLEEISSGRRATKSAGGN